MRRLALAVTLLVSATALPAQQGGDADRAAGGGGRLPAGWQARLDKASARITDLSFSSTGSGFRATSGPAAIFYHPRYKATGAYEIGATFAQAKAPEHPEAYGLFFGGTDLNGPNQAYFYFLVRGDGQYSIRHRAGNDVHTLVDWTASPAVKSADASGRASNVVRVLVEAQNVRFLINEQEVKQFPRTQLDKTDGQAGIRVNHNLDVAIDGFLLKPIR